MVMISGIVSLPLPHDPDGGLPLRGVLEVLRRDRVLVGDDDVRRVPEDLDLLGSITSNIMGRTICALGDAASMPVQSFIKHYRDEFAYHIENRKCLVPVDVQRAGSSFFTATV